MLIEVYFKGEITVRWKCGCWARMGVERKGSMTTAEVIDYSPCKDHGGGFLLCLKAKDLLEAVRKEKKLPSIFDLLSFFDEVETKESPYDFV